MAIGDMKRIKLTQSKVALIDDKDFELISQYKWMATKTRSGIFYATTRNSVTMHRLINKTPKGLETDHINGNGLDNRRKNLRSCSAAENQWNSKKSIKNKSGFRGVCWHKRDKVWQAGIYMNSKYIFLGTFDDKVDAARTFDKAVSFLRDNLAKKNLKEEKVDRA